MSQTKRSREPKCQLGQFFTPPSIARAIIDKLQVRPDERVLEPSLGKGAFVFALLDALAGRQSPERLVPWANSNTVALVS